MHCKACEIMIESELREVPYVAKVNANLDAHSVEIGGHFGDMEMEEVAKTLTKFIENHGYSLSIKKETRTKNWSEFKVAVPVALIFGFLFVALQKMGIVNLVNTSSVSYGTAFVIGIIASLSTCMAAVGGLVLSMSATFAKEGSRIKPQLLFHIGRIVSFFLLGGMIGAIGLVFTLSTSATFILNLIVAAVMFILGINLLDVFHFSKKFQIEMPKFFSRHIVQVSKINRTMTPLFVGIVTFFLPCGFTQSMQIYTLSTGGFIAGGLTMLSFALGTLPALALVSFSSFSIRNSSKSGIFFKSAGLIVILFALFNLLNNLVIMGLIPPLFNF